MTDKETVAEMVKYDARKKISVKLNTQKLNMNGNETRIYKGSA